MLVDTYKYTAHHFVLECVAALDLAVRLVLLAVARVDVDHIYWAVGVHGAFGQRNLALFEQAQPDCSAVGCVRRRNRQLGHGAGKGRINDRDSSADPAHFAVDRRQRWGTGIEHGRSGCGGEPGVNAHGTDTPRGWKLRSNDVMVIS